MKKLLSLALVAFLGLTTATAQLIQVVNEVVMDEATFYGLNPAATPGSYPAGGETYRIYADVQDADDFLTSVFAIGNCYSMEMLASNTFHNMDVGSNVGSGISPGFFGIPIFAASQWDSFATIGRASQIDPGAAISVAASDPANFWTDPTATFNMPAGFAGAVQSSNDMNLNDGAWFALNGDANGLGVLNGNGFYRILIAQVTVTAPLSYKLNVQLLDGGSSPQYYVWDPGQPLICTTGIGDIDGSAIGLVFPFVPGCTDPAALNFDAAATADDGSCIVPPCAPTAESDCYSNNGDDLVIVATGADPITIQFGTTDIEVCCDVLNVYDGSDNTGTPLLTGATGDLDGTILVATSGNMYFEYLSDGSFSCDDALQGATNFDLYCGEIQIPGCTNSFALNFDSNANFDDGSCILPNCAPVADSYCYDDFGDSFVIDADGADPIVLEITAGTIEIQWDDLNIYDGTDNSGTPLLLGSEGDQTGVVVEALSGNMFVEFDSDGSGSCADAQESLLEFNIYCGTRNTDVLGCTDPTACNFDSNATIDDGSCAPAVANDDCATAEALTSGVTVTGDNTNACGVPAIATVPVGTTGPSPTCNATDGWCGGDTGVQNDVWYSFTMPAGDAEVDIVTSGFDTQIALYADCAGTFIGANDDGNGVAGALSYACGELLPEITYFVLVDGYQGATGTFDITVTINEGPCAADPEGCTDPTACNFDPAAVIDNGSCIAAVANDNCSGAIAVTSGVTVNVDNTLACGTPEVASPPAGTTGPSCLSTDGWCSFQLTVDNDVWYSFTTPANDAQVTIETSADGSFTVDDTQIAVYDACGGNLVAANDDNPGGTFFSFLTFNCGTLAPNTTYYVMVDGYDATQVGTFNLDITIDEAICLVPVLGCTNPAACNFDSLADTDDGSCILPVANDDCANAIPVALNSTVVGDNGCATADGPGISCGVFGDVFADNDVWFSFVAPGPAAALISIETFEGTNTDTQIQVLDACGGNVIACDDDNGTDLFMSLVEIEACDLVEGNTYLIQVDGWGAEAGTFTLSITTGGDIVGCTDPLSLNYNACATIDDGSCIAGIASAISINTQLFPNCTGVLGTTVIPAETALPEQGPFFGNPDDEAWYSFTVPCDGGVKVLCDAIDLDMVVEVYDDQLNFLAAGDDNAALGEYAFTQGVNAGDLLYARLYAYGTGSTSQFNICVTSFCASSPDDPYPTLTYDACDVYKCDFIAGANNYDWTFTPQGGGADLTYSSPNNNTFVNLGDLSGPVAYGETYDVTIDANFTDGDIGLVTINGIVSDVCVMAAGPSTQLRADFVGGTYPLGASLRCPNACNADEYIWTINEVGGATLPSVSVPGTSTLLPLVSVPGLLPGTAYEVQIEVVYDGVTYAPGALLPFFTEAAPLVEVRAADICGNAGPLPYGYYIRTNVNAPGADDYTWEFTNTNGVEPSIYWRKGDGVRILLLNAVKDGGGNNLLVQGETYNVRVKPEYGNFVSGGNDNPGLEPTYDFATSYGATQQICIVGAAPVDGGSADLRTETSVSIEAALYPNPSNGGFVNLNVNNIDVTADKVSVDIYDLFGKLVQSEQIATTGSSNLNVVLNLNKSMASGLYMVNITVGEVVQTERLVIEK